MSRTFISFPEGRLGESPCRLSLLARGAEWFALEKPPGVAAVRDAFSRGRVHLMEVLREDIDSGKNQLREAGITEALPVTYPDPGVAGVLLCAKSEAARAALKNAMGANGFVFKHRFLTPSGAEGEEMVCDLPLAHPEKSARMVVSHTNGKKTETRFRRIGEVGGYALWEAWSHYNRHHQVAVHAFECGIPVLGETLYARSEPVYLSSLKRGYRAKGREQPLYAHPCLYQTELRLSDPDTGEAVIVESPLPRRLKALMDQVERRR